MSGRGKGGMGLGKNFNWDDLEEEYEYDCVILEDEENETIGMSRKESDLKKKELDLKKLESDLKKKELDLKKMESDLKKKESDLVAKKSNPAAKKSNLVTKKSNLVTKKSSVKSKVEPLICSVCYKTMRKNSMKSMLECGHVFHSKCLKKQKKGPMTIFCPQHEEFVSSFFPSSKCIGDLTSFYDDYSEGLPPCKGCGKCT